MTSRTHETTPRDTARNAWRDAVWASPLPPFPRLVALTFADHAAPDGRRVWVTLERGMERTGMGRTAWSKHRDALVRLGWLTEARAWTPNTAAVFKLTVPGVECREAALNTDPECRETAVADIDECRGTVDDYRRTAPASAVLRHQSPEGTPEEPLPPSLPLAASQQQDGGGAGDDVRRIAAAHRGRYPAEVVAHALRKLRRGDGSDAQIGNPVSLLASPKGAERLDVAQQAHDQRLVRRRHSETVAAEQAAAAANAAAPAASFVIAKRTRKGPAEPGDFEWLALRNLAEGRDAAEVAAQLARRYATVPVAVRPWTGELVTRSERSRER